MKLKKIFSRQNIIISLISILITLVVLVYIFTLGARITKARETYLEAYQLAYDEGIDNLTDETRSLVTEKSQESLDLWYDPEVEEFLSTIENQ